MNNIGIEQPAYLHSMTNAFVTGCQDSIMHILIPRPSLAAFRSYPKTGLVFLWSKGKKQEPQTNLIKTYNTLCPQQLAHNGK